PRRGPAPGWLQRLRRSRRAGGGPGDGPRRRGGHGLPRRVRALPGQGDLREHLSMGFSTDCIHAGQEPDPSTGAIVTPIFQTSTYVQEGIGQHKGYEYARTQNPTRRALEKNLAALEAGSDAYCFASGMAATNAVLTLVKAGQRVVVSDNVYGGTHRLITKLLGRNGVASTFLDASDPAAFDAAAGEFALLWIETPTNPLMKICDIAALAESAHKRGALLVVDNTFMSPFFQRPLKLGADIVVHSTTKFLNGHSDSVAR